MAATRFLTYYIVLTDPALVAQYQAQFPYGYQFAPFNPHDNVTGLPGGAAVAFSAPWAGSFPGTDPNHVGSGTYFGAAPFTWSPEWISANNYDCTVASFQRHSGGFWGIGGSNVTYYWLGQFVLAEPAVPTVNHVPPPAPQVPAKRRFIEGFEFGNAGSNGFNLAGSGMSFSRDAARHVGGRGLAFRGPSNCAVLVNHANFIAALDFRTWERFYIRLRQTDPANTVVFWQTKGDVDNAGFSLGMTAGGQLAFFVQTGGAVRTLIQTSAAIPAWTGLSTDDAWHKVDLLIRYNPGAPQNAYLIRVFLDGAEIMTINGTAVVASQHHNQTVWGSEQIGTALYMDVDDWMVAEWPGPAEPAGPALTGFDWLSGTKIVRARPKQFSANHNAGAWAGGLQTLLQNGMDSVGNLVGIVSTTNGSIAEVDLDLATSFLKDEGAKGVLSFVINAVAKCNTTSTVSYLLNGAAAVTSAFLTSAGFTSLGASLTGAFNRSYFKSLTDGVSAANPAFTSLAVRHTKSADVNADNTASLDAQFEMWGMWGKADQRATENAATPPAVVRYVGQHNAPYPNSIFAKATAAPPPNAPVVIVSGTYVGNGLGQDITFRTPPHFLFIRKTAGDGGGFKWWSTMIGAHFSTQQGEYPFLECDLDQTFVPGVGVDLQQERYRLRIAGNNTDINGIGLTYQYIAFSDPGARFALCGTMQNKASLASFVYKLLNPTFTPEAMLMFGETFDATATPRMLFKGLGTSADAVMHFDAVAQTAAALTFGAGTLTTQAALHGLISSAQFPFILFRRADGNNDPGQAAVMALVNWTGDGNASRTVGLSPASGKRPIFALICPDGAGGGVFRDVAHTGTNSSKDVGTNTTTGITGGGIDSISVGVSLNANGVNYSGIVFLGSAVAGNGGFGVDGEYIPVEAAPPADGPFPPAPDLNVLHPVVPVVPIVGEPDLEDITTLSDVATSIGGLVGGQHCEYYTRHVVNMALSRIGVSARVANIATEQTQAAITARSHILEDVNQVLRDFDWPFATRYANLVLVAGTTTVPAEQDWQYSYRAPNAMMKARRLVGQAGQQRAFDPNPPKFRVGSDAIGPLIYTNEVATAAMPLTLEYTIRQICPAFYGDALFRDSLAWKFGFSLAPVLAKDSKKQEYCRQMYERSLALAKVPASQEQQQAPNGDAEWINDREAGPGGSRNPWDR